MFILLLLMLGAYASGQEEHTVDELLGRLDSTRRDTVQWQILFDLVDAYFEDPKAQHFIARCDKLLDELERDTSAQVRAFARRHRPTFLNYQALDHLTRKDYLRALRLFQEALAIHQQEHDTNGILLMYNNIGFMQDGFDAPHAIIAYKEALRIARSDSAFAEWTFSIGPHIGELYTQIGELDSAEHYLRGL